MQMASHSVCATGELQSICLCGVSEAVLLLSHTKHFTPQYNTAAADSEECRMLRDQRDN